MTARALLPAFAFAFVLAACATSAPPKTVPESGRPTCASHADCVITTFGGCCTCCERSPHAMLRSELGQQEGSCPGKECTHTCSPDIECEKHEPVDTYAARCKDGTCVAEKK